MGQLMARIYFGKKRIPTALLKKRIRSTKILFLTKPCEKYRLHKRLSGELFASLHRSRAFLDLLSTISLINSGIANLIISTPSVYLASFEGCKTFIPNI